MRRIHGLFSRRAMRAPISFLGLLVAAGPLAMSPGSSPEPITAAEAAYRHLAPLPAGSSAHDRDGLEASAIALATSLGGVTADAEGGHCAADELVVRWTEPVGATVGAFVAPLGPAPTGTTDDVNGIVACRTSSYGYMGFQASWTGTDWNVTDVPFVGGEDDEAALPVQPPPTPPADTPATPPLTDLGTGSGTVTGPIEGFAAYEPQRTCDPSAKPGTRALAAALLRDYPGSRNLGIVRGCSVGARSEHKEGRAFDWGVNITRPAEKADAEAFIGALLATDAAGNKDALARRMGVMYLIWNEKIWSAYRAADGWRPYSGPSPHRDHIHISLSWAGAMGRTSFWSGSVPADLPVATAAGTRTSSSNGHGSATGRLTHATHVVRTRTRTHTTLPVADTTVPRHHHWTPPSTVPGQDQTQWRHHRWQEPDPTTAAEPSDTTTDQPVTTPTDGVRRHRRDAWRPDPSITTTTTPPETTTTVPPDTTTSTSVDPAPSPDASTTTTVVDAGTDATSTTSTTVPPWRTGGDGSWRQRHHRR